MSFSDKNEPKLIDDIQKSSDWVAKALNSPGYNTDYSLKKPIGD